MGLSGTTVNRPLNGLTLLKIEYALRFLWRWCPLVLVSFQVFSEPQMESEVCNMPYRPIQFCHMRQMFPYQQENKQFFCDTLNPLQCHISDITKTLLLFAERRCSCLPVQYKRYTMMELNSRWALYTLTWNWHNTIQKNRFMLCVLCLEYQQVLWPSGR